MKKSEKILSITVLLGTPFVLILMIWSFFDNPQELSRSSGLVRRIWDTLGWALMIWIVAFFSLLIKMVFIKDFRDIMLEKIAGTKERDEREAIVSGNAAKFSFLSTIAITLLFIFLSVINIKVAKHPDLSKASGESGYISIGINFSVLEKAPTTKKPQNENTIIHYSGIPISKVAILLLMVFWLLASYRYKLKKELSKF